MTLPYERLRSLKVIRPVLDQLYWQKGPYKKGEVRRIIRMLTRHYPYGWEIDKYWKEPN